MPCLPVQVATVVEPLEGGIEITGVGSSSTGTLPQSTLSYSITVEEGLLVVAVELFDTVSASIPTVTYDGGSMSIATWIPSIHGTHKPAVAIFTKVVTAGSGSVVVTPTTSLYIQSQAWGLTGLENNTVDGTNTLSGSTESTLTSGTVVATTADSAIIAVFALNENTPESYAWGGGFVAGSQGFQTTIADTIACTEGRQIGSILGGYQASVTPSGGNHIGWAGAIVIFS